DLAAAPKPKRAWGPEQATGPPDTQQAGDIQTAWASLSPDGSDEWLLLEYAEPAAAGAGRGYGTHNPGAPGRVTVLQLDGEEVEVWKGKDPTPVNSGMGTSEVTFRVPFKTNRVKIYLDSKNVPGWNEIDAVGLRDTGGKTHWAVSAAASSTYAEQGGAAAFQMQLAPAAPARVIVMPAHVPPAPPQVPAPGPGAPGPAPQPVPVPPAQPAPPPAPASPAA